MLTKNNSLQLRAGGPLDVAEGRRVQKAPESFCPWLSARQIEMPRTARLGTAGDPGLSL